jgi:tRNA threonylcarbamoyladenosine biosynthesis protein TsaE
VPSRTFVTDSPEATVELGRQLAAELTGVVLLIGNLGAGKTTLTKGIVEGRGAASAEAVSSPTFTLIHQYDGERPVFHIDLYRLDEVREVETLGLEDLFRGSALVLLEWAERFPSLLPAQRTEIRLRVLEDERREIVVTAGTESAVSKQNQR